MTDTSILSLANTSDMVEMHRAESSDTNRADMDAHLPAPLAAMWADSGEALFERFIVDLRS